MTNFIPCRLFSDCRLTHTTVNYSKNQHSILTQLIKKKKKKGLQVDNIGFDQAATEFFVITTIFLIHQCTTSNDPLKRYFPNSQLTKLYHQPNEAYTQTKIHRQARSQAPTRTAQRGTYIRNNFPQPLQAAAVVEIEQTAASTLKYSRNAGRARACTSRRRGFIAPVATPRAVQDA